MWSWHPDADAKLADDDQQMTVTIEPVAGEITKETVKTIRVRECRGDPGATVVTNSRVFYFPREATGATGTRHSRAPSVDQGRTDHEQLGRHSRRGKDWR